MKPLRRTRRNVCFILTFIIVLLYCTNFRRHDNKLDIPIIKKSNFTITITVKTTFKNHEKKVPELVDTWFRLAPNSVYFVTDAFDPVVNNSVNGNLISTDCDNDYNVNSSGCKLNYALRHMLKKNAMWSCHFTDDTYVNMPILKKLLKGINHELPYYLGQTLNQMPIIVGGEIFWYAKNGACLSRAALEKIEHKVLDNQFYADYVKHDKMAGEVALGYLMKLNGIIIHELPNFYADKTIPQEMLNKTAALSYRKNKRSLIQVPYYYEPQYDPNKLQTLHCFLYQHQCNTKLGRLNINILK